MGARNKLNVAHLNGNLLIAGLAGMFTGSFLVFAVGLAILVILDVHTGGIRPTKRDR
jgi:hypothetical protein